MMAVAPAVPVSVSARISSNSLYSRVRLRDWDP